MNELKLRLKEDGMVAATMIEETMDHIMEVERKVTEVGSTEITIEEVEDPVLAKEIHMEPGLIDGEAI